MHRRRRALLSVALGATLAWPGLARAGGFEVADHGGQAMGRGGAFVARADDPSAIHHNPAGLARQRGTRLYGSGNVFFHSYEFRRSGAFPDDPNDPATPWGGRPYPSVSNSAGPFVTPFLALASDFGSFDRLTIAAGVYGPSSIGNRTFPLGVDSAPASSRYDFVQARTRLVYPTLAAGYRVTKWLDVGVSAHLALANFEETRVTYVDLGECKNAEYQPCDMRNNLAASATTVAGTFGAMIRPSESLAFGLSVRTPMGFNAQGTLSPQSPRLPQDTELASGAASYFLDLPLVVRAGARFVSMDADFEVYDLEADVVYEQWGTAQRDGPILVAPDIGSIGNIQSTIVHHYKDTFSVRGGGAYNLDLGEGVVALRAGGWFDTPATDHAYTRLDYDTLAKVAGTLGVGYRSGAYGVDVAYAAIASVPRVVGVGAGQVRPLNDAQNGQPVDAAGQALPAVNEGAYRGFTHVISLAASVTFDGFFGITRTVHYGNPYEPGYVPAANEEKPASSSEPEAGEGGETRKPRHDEDEPEAKPPPKKKDDAPQPEKKKEWWEELD